MAKSIVVPKPLAETGKPDNPFLSQLAPFCTIVNYQQVIVSTSTGGSQALLYEVPGGFDFFITSLSCSSLASAVPGSFYAFVDSVATFLYYFYSQASVDRSETFVFSFPVKIRSGQKIYAGTACLPGGVTSCTMTGFLYPK